MKQVFVAGLCCFLCGAVQAAEESLTFNLPKGPDFGYVQLQHEYYYTEDNYRAWFESQPLAGGRGKLPLFFQYILWDLSLGYHFGTWLETELFVRGGWLAQSGDGTNLKTSAPNLYRGGGVLRSHQSWGQGFGGGLVEELSVSLPFRSLKPGMFKPWPDDGSLHLNPALWLYAAFWQTFYPFGKVAFQFRNQGLSDLLKLRLGLLIRMGVMSEVGACVYGFLSAVKSASANLSQEELLSRLHAGSRKFGSLNPAVMGGLVWLKWQLPYFTLRLSGDMDINGTHYAKGYTFQLAVLWKWGAYHNLEDMFEESQNLSFPE